MHVIDPTDDLAINLFDLADNTDVLIDLLDYIFANMLTDMRLSGHQTLMLTECIIAVKANPQPSIWKLRDILTNGPAAYERCSAGSMKTIKSTSSKRSITPTADGQRPP